jgi:hypothetical protein
MDTTVESRFRLQFVGPDTSAGQVPAERHGGSGDERASQDGEVSLSIAFPCVYKYQFVPR